MFYIFKKKCFLIEKIGVIDAFRHFYPDKREAYTCWNTKTSARLTNYGTRIDYILLSSDLLPILESCEIISDYQGSDHCPVQAVLKCDAISEKIAQLPSICTRLWPEFSGQQQKLKAFFQRTQVIADNITKNSEPCVQSSISKSKGCARKNKQKSIKHFFKAPATNIPKNSGIQMTLCKENNISERTNGTSNTSADFCKSELILLSKSGNADSDTEMDCTGSSGKSGSSNNSESSETDSTRSSGNSESSNKIESCGKSESSLAWKMVLSGPPKPPLCSGHQKECVLRTVKKKGPNCGRNFFMCAQPAGHPSNPDASCNYFKWVNAPKVNSLKKS